MEIFTLKLVQLFLTAKKVGFRDIQNDSLSKILLKEKQNTCFVAHVYITTKNTLIVQIIGI